LPHGNQAAILALLIHNYHHAILISQVQQITLKCKCPVGISDVTAILAPAIRFAARADYQFRQSVRDSFASVLTKPDLRAVWNSPHLFTLYSPSTFGFVMMIAL
jgi:hypothetical protein